MGCVCCSLGSFASILLDALERISMCTVCAALICCLLFTILFVLVIGVGIGYHYCFVQNSVDAMAKAAKAAGALRSGPEDESRRAFARSVDKAVARGFAHRMRRDIDELGQTITTNYSTKGFKTTFLNSTGLFNNLTTLDRTGLFNNLTTINRTKYTIT